MASLAQQRRLQLAERRRAMIHAEAHIQMLEMAAAGWIPVFDPKTQKPTGEFEQVESKERIRVAQSLLDKAVPNTVMTADTGHESLDAKEAQLLIDDDDALDAMSYDELRELANLPQRPDAETSNPWED